MCKLNVIEKELGVIDGELDLYIDGDSEDIEVIQPDMTRLVRRKTDRKKASKKLKEAAVHKSMGKEPVGKFIPGIPKSQKKKKLVVEQVLTPSHSERVRLQSLFDQEQEYFQFEAADGRIGIGYEIPGLTCDNEDCEGKQYLVEWADHKDLYCEKCSNIKWISDEHARVS